MKKDNNTFAFDIGITSIGSAIAEGNELKYLGVRMFDSATEAKDARLVRSARRNLARKKWRKQQLKNAFIDFGLVVKEEINKESYGRFTASDYEGKDKTVYHLRKRALNSEISVRELYMCLLNMLHARGHFNMEMYDFTNDPITLQAYIDNFYDVARKYISIFDSEKKSFEQEILKPIYEGKANKQTIKLVSTHRFVEEEQEKPLIELLNLLCNYKAKIRNIDENLIVKKESLKLDELRSEDEIDEFFAQCIDLFDMSRISQILDKYNYLCEKAVEEIDSYEKTYTERAKNPKEWEEKEKNIRGITKGKHLRAWRNLQNNYPNGLYLKEASTILFEQQKYNKKITNDFIEAINSIISARIPYYIGPLNENGKNAWLSKNKTIGFKYGYEYTQKHSDNKAVDEPQSIQTWMDRMRSHCTYLPDEFALPKGSFIGETFNIINELNILSALDNNGNDYYLTFEDKVKIFDKLFLKKSKVDYQEIADLLKISSFGPKKTGTKEPTFNNVYTLYHTISSLDSNLEFKTIMELFDDVEKVEKIEDIILKINLFSEEKTKEDYFRDKCLYSQDVSKKLAKLKSNSFYSFSKKFLFNIFIDKDGNSIMSKLFSDNKPGMKNEQMTIIQNAVTSDGEPLDFVTNKYVRIIQENNGKLGIDLLMSGDKPIIPTSRPVIRALNECMKVYSEMVKVYGVPKRVIIETARDFKDFSETGVKSEKRFNKLENLYNDLISQIKEKKLYDSGKNIEDWDELKEYVEKNALKIELYLRQNGIDLLTGETINIHKLNEYEIDHILPRGFGDDSRDDKMLTSKLANGMKGDRLPLEFIESGDTVGTVKITSSEYEKRVRNLFELGLISEMKYKRLMLANASEMENFINQNLVDTRYIIREFMSILRAYNQVHKYDTHIVALKSAYTSLYRKAFNMEKDRDFGDQHHAHDAALLLIADKTLSTYYPNYDLRKQAGSGDSLGTYRGFMKAMNDSFGDNEEARERGKQLKEFIRYTFYKTYGMTYDNSESIVSKVKAYIPFYSKKVEKNHTGKFFEATIHGQDEFEQDAPLSILGVNDDKKVFSGVECVAVDFYKYTDSKGKRKHLGVHIPKVIISHDGKIDKEKYISLIKNYYKVPELLDENGEIKLSFFRFRAFRNDIIYDTETNNPMLFNIGSIKLKKLEKKFINMFSYNNIYLNAAKLRNDLNKYFNLKTRNNKDGVLFTEIGKDVFINYIVNNVWHLNLEEKVIKTLCEKVENCNSIYDLSKTMAYYEWLVKKPEYPPTIDGQFIPTINNNTIAKNENAQYIKLKYNILGIRFYTNENNKLIIETPREVQGAYSKIKREDFSWHISKYVV